MTRSFLYVLGGTALVFCLFSLPLCPAPAQAAPGEDYYVLGGGGGGGGGGGNGGGGGTGDDTLPVKDDDGNGYSPIKDPASAMNGDGLYFKIYYPDLDDTNNNAYYHDGAIHLEDVIGDGNYDGVTAAAVDPKYSDYITIGVDQHGKPSILYSYTPSNQELYDWAVAHGMNEDIFIQAEVVLTRDDGKTATVTINMYYWYSSMTFL